MDEYLLSTIHAQFLAMVPIRNFPWMNVDQSTMQILQSQDTQLAILNVTVNSDICKRYPSSLKYQQSFVKSLVQKCESSNCDLVDELYEAYTSLISKPQSETADCYRTYLLPGATCTVTLKESVNMISQGTTGLNTWPAASFLTEWVMENKDTLSGRVALELGSGMGLTGLAICKLCRPARYVFSDCHTSVLRGLRENIAINMPGTDLEEIPENGLTEGRGASHQEAGNEDPDISVEFIDWETVEERDMQRWNAGVLLAADVVYDTRIIEALVRLLHLLLRCQGDGRGRPVAFVASTVRNDETYGAFLEALEKYHVVIEKVQGPQHQTLHYDRSCPIQLVCLRIETT